MRYEQRRDVVGKHKELLSFEKEHLSFDVILKNGRLIEKNSEVKVVQFYRKRIVLFFCIYGNLYR